MDQQTPPDWSGEVAGGKERRTRQILAVGAVAIVGLIAGILLRSGDDSTPAPGGAIDEATGALIDVRPPAPRTVDSTAPDFTVDTIDGDRFTLSTHLAEVGTPVVLNLWASWCFPCRAEMPELSAAAERHRGIQFIGVAVQDDPVAAEQFANEIGVAYPLAIDEFGNVDALYPTVGLPVTYLISADGQIVKTMIGQVDGDDIDASLAIFTAG